jgi:transposase
MRAWGSRYARVVFERCGRNKRRACRHLDISYHTLEAYLRYSRRDGEAVSQSPAWVRSASGPDAVKPATSVHERRQEP